MIVGSTTSNPSTSQAASTAGASAPDYQSFLKLLVEQMKNQDPTEPTSSTDMLAQLASFSSVEQQTTTNSRLDAIGQSLALIQSASLVGMTASSSDGSQTGRIASVYWDSGTAVARLENGATLPLTSDIRVSR